MPTLESLERDQSDKLARMLTEKLRAYASARSEQESVWRDDFEAFNLEFKEEQDETEGKGGRSDAKSGLSRKKVKVFTALTTDLYVGQGKMPFELKNTPIPDYAIQYNNGELQKEAFDFLKNDTERTEGMHSLIEDQLVEGKFPNELHNVIYQLGLFGSGAIEGPNIERKTRVRYLPRPIPHENVIIDPQTGKPDPASVTPHMAFDRETYEKAFPCYKQRDIWDVYPDLTHEDPQEGEGIFVVDELTQHQLAEMSQEMDEDGTPQYDVDAIEDILNSTTTSEDHMELDRGPHRDLFRAEEKASLEGNTEEATFYVCTYHGRISVADLEGFENMDQADEDKYKGDDQGNMPIDYYLAKEMIVTFCQGRILKVEKNTDPKKHRKIKIAPMFKNPGSPFGWSIRHEMKDPESAFNAFLRLFIDNKRRAAYVDEIIDMERVINADELPAFGRQYEVEPGASTDRAVERLVYPDVGQGVLETLQYFESWGDSASSIPAFLEGGDVQTGSDTAYEVNKVTDSAMKMLSLTMKSIDEMIMVPCVESLFSWNMDNAEDETIKGDYEVVAKGQQSFKDNIIVANEILKFLNLASSNEALSQEIDYEEAIRRLSTTAQVGLESLIKSPEKKKQEQAMMQQAQEMAMQQQIQSLQMQNQLKIQEIVAKVQAEHQAEMEQLQAKHQSEMMQLGAKVSSDADKALLDVELKRDIEGLRVLANQKQHSSNKDES